MKRLSRSLVIGVQRVRKVRAILAEPQYRRALRHRVAASVEHQHAPLAHNYRTILDVGANRGQFALVAAQRFPHAKLICFEPQAAPRRTLEDVLYGHPCLRVSDAALAATAGTAVFHITQANDSSSLLRSTELQVGTFPGSRVVDQTSVETQRLDSAVPVTELERPALLKIDVQGTELEVLTGAVGLLESIDTILIECSLVELYAGQALAGDILAFLHQHGFRMAHLLSPTIGDDGQVLQLDVVLERMQPGALEAQH